MATITDVGNYSRNFSSSPIVTGDFLPAADSVLVAVIGLDAFTLIDSISGHALGGAWEILDTYLWDGSSSAMVYICHTGSSPVSGAVTINMGSSATMGVKLFYIEGLDVSGTVANSVIQSKKSNLSSSAAPTLTFDTTPTDFTIGAFHVYGAVVDTVSGTRLGTDVAYRYGGRHSAVNYDAAGASTHSGTLSFNNTIRAWLVEFKEASAGGTTVVATKPTVTFTAHDALVGVPSIVEATKPTLTFTAHDAVVLDAHQAQATKPTITFTAHDAFIGKTTVIEATKPIVTFTPYDATVTKSKEVVATATTITFTAYPATITTTAEVLLTDDLNLFIGEDRSAIDNQVEVHSGYNNKSIMNVMQGELEFDLAGLSRVQIIINSVVVLDSNTGSAFAWKETLPPALSGQDNVILANLGDIVLAPEEYYSNLVIWIGSNKFVVTKKRRLLLDVKLP